MSDRVKAHVLAHPLAWACVLALLVAFDARGRRAQLRGPARVLPAAAIALVVMHLASPLNTAAATPEWAAPPPTCSQFDGLASCGWRTARSEPSADGIDF